MGFLDKQVGCKKYMQETWKLLKGRELTEDELAEYYTYRACFFNGLDISPDNLLYPHTNRDFSKVSEKSLEMLGKYFMEALERIDPEHYPDILGFLDKQPLDHLIEKMKLANSHFYNMKFEVQEPNMAMNNSFSNIGNNPFGFFIDSASKSVRDLSNGFTLYFFGPSSLVNREAIVSAISSLVALEPFCAYITQEPILKQKTSLAMIVEDAYPVKICYKWQRGLHHQELQDLMQQQAQGKISNLNLRE